MRKIDVSAHTLVRWKERVGTDIDKHYIEKLFRNNSMTVLELGWSGRLIVKVKDYVFVVSKTNTRTLVHTTYGKVDTYELKRPYVEDYSSELALIKWNKQRGLELHRRNSTI